MYDYIDLQAIDDWSKVPLIARTTQNICQMVDIIYQLKGVEPELAYPTYVKSVLTELFNRHWNRSMESRFLIKCFYRVWELTKLPEFEVEKVNWIKDWWFHDLMKWHLGFDIQPTKSLGKVVRFHIQWNSVEFGDLIIHFLKWLVSSDDGRRIVIDEIKSMNKLRVSYSTKRVDECTP